MVNKRPPSAISFDDISPFIVLGHGLIARIDAEDVELVSGFYWSAYQPPRSGFYARASRGQGKIRLHRLIAGAVDGEVVDHINGDTLDNRRVNLRRCSPTENKRNRRPNAGVTSGYKGVYGRAPRWFVQIRANKKRFHIGSFSCRHEAARAYNAAAKQHFGEFARLNHVEADHA